MPVDQQKYNIIFNKMAQGYNVIEDEESCFLSMCLRNVELDDLKAEYQRIGLDYSHTDLRQEIADFGVLHSHQKVSMGKSWRVDEIFCGEIVQLYTYDRRQLQLVKVDHLGRFWVADDSTENNHLRGRYISFIPETQIGEEREIKIDESVVKIDRVFVLTPTIPMQFMNHILTPLLHQYTCNDNLEANVIIPLYEWCRDEVRPKKWVSINKWRSECLKAEEAGIDAFTFWYLTEHVLRNLDVMYQ